MCAFQTPDCIYLWTIVFGSHCGYAGSHAMLQRKLLLLLQSRRQAIRWQSTPPAISLHRGQTKQELIKLQHTSLRLLQQSRHSVPSIQSMHSKLQSQSKLLRSLRILAITRTHSSNHHSSNLGVGTPFLRQQQKSYPASDRSMEQSSIKQRLSNSQVDQEL